MDSLKQIRTACNRDCPDACGVVATVRGGRVERLDGQADHPVTQGFLCRRTSRFLDRQYHQDRLQSPLVREGERFRPISWEAAFERIAEQMVRCRDESGGASILHYRSGGSLGMIKHVTDHFFAEFGPVTTKSGDICSGAGEAAQVIDFGVCDSHDVFDLRNSSTIILWGKNVLISSVHLIPILKEARRRGTTIVLIDPVRTRTAQLCDVYFQPRPGGDAAVACGIVRYLVDRDRLDPEAEKYCDQWDEFLALVRTRSVDQWAAAADLPVDQLKHLADLYGGAGPSAILVGWGMQRRRYAAATVRTIDALAAVTGNLGRPGGGVSFYFRRRGAFDLSFLSPKPPPRQIPEPLLGPGILAAKDPPVRMVWVTAGNPVCMLPQSRTVAEALSTRELTVVVDSFMTDTARAAHLVLPTTTLLEEVDLLGAYGHHYITATRAVVPPPVGVKTDYEISAALAKRLAMGSEWEEDPEFWLRRMLRPLAGQDVTLERLQEQAVRNPRAEKVLFADRRFATSSGKVNLISSLPAQLTSPLANGEAARLAAFSTDQAQCSQWLPHEQIGPATAYVHPSMAIGMNDGDLACLRTSQGEMTVRLKFDNQQHPQLVRMDKGGWLVAGRCANMLLKAETTDLGLGGALYDTSVTVSVAR